MEGLCCPHPGLGVCIRGAGVEGWGCCAGTLTGAWSSSVPIHLLPMAPTLHTAHTLPRAPVLHMAPTLHVTPYAASAYGP